MTLYYGKRYSEVHAPPLATFFTRSHFFFFGITYIYTSNIDGMQLRKKVALREIAGRKPALLKIATSTNI